MPTLSQGLEESARLVRNVVNTIENNIIKSQREIVDKKTISTVVRLLDLLDKVAYLFENIAKKVGASEEDVVTLSNYTYLFRSQKEIALLRTRPEYVILAYDWEASAVSFKVKSNMLTISPSMIEVNSRGVSFKIDPLRGDQFIGRRDELRIILKIFEKALYRKLLPYIEQKIVKK